jgi:sugar O-acyltransferase (sialic acid O-acetyltransferase NeuD family)
MIQNSIILVGAGGHCRSVIDVIETQGQYRVMGIVDSPELVGSKVLGYTVTGADSDLEEMLKNCPNIHITVGHIKTAAVRRKLFENCKMKGAKFPVIISPKAHVSFHATLGEGSIVMHHAIVNAGARVGINTIVNTGAVIEHDATVGNHCHVSTGCYLNGGVTIGDGTFTGSQSTVIQGIEIGAGCVVGAGSVVTRNLTSNGIYAGNPARLIQQ